MNPKMDNKNRGFTFIELLIVLAIIGIIAAISVPRFLNTLNQSSEKAELVSAQLFAQNVEYEYMLGLLNEDSQGVVIVSKESVSNFSGEIPKSIDSRYSNLSAKIYKESNAFYIMIFYDEDQSKVIYKVKINESTK